MSWHCCCRPTDCHQFNSVPLFVFQSRAALSLLGYCYYHIQDFSSSAECYEQLTQLHPEVEDYKVYHVQSLYKAGAYPEATKASFALDNTGSHAKVHARTHYNLRSENLVRANLSTHQLDLLVCFIWKLKCQSFYHCFPSPVYQKVHPFERIFQTATKKSFNDRMNVLKHLK